MLMNDFLPYFVLFLGAVVLLGFFNERVTKITYEIALMLFAVVIGVVLLILSAVLHDTIAYDILEEIQTFDLEGFLMDGVLCFMLFAGSCHMNLKDFREQARQITVLSIFATLFGAVFYGVAFFLFGKLLGLSLTLPVCLMFGSIVAPTDPIAATSILKKFNLPKNIGFLIEAESLLNDGVGVALFVCFSGMVSASGGSGNVVLIMLKEIIGAVVVGGIVTVICFLIFSKTKDSKRRIFTSLLAVALSYLICDHFGFSGAIASVVCGVLYSTFIDRIEQNGAVLDLMEFDAFWDVLDNFLNSILYVILGLGFVRIFATPKLILVTLVAILCNLIGRGGSLSVCSLFLGKIPDGYDKGNFVKLLTWAGLRGGLCIALAMSAKSLLDTETYRMILGATYAIVFFTTIIQGLTMPAVYRRIDRSVKNKRTSLN